MVIVIVFGLPGSGKSYFARALAAALDCPLISSDAVRQQMQQNGRYDDQTKTAVYQEMLSLMEAGIKEHKSLLLDATFYKAGIRKLFIDKAGELDYPIYFIEIRAADETIKTRLSNKRPDSEADFDVYLKIKPQFEQLTGPHLVLYSDREPLGQMLAKAQTYLKDAAYETK